MTEAERQAAARSVGAAQTHLASIVTILDSLPLTDMQRKVFAATIGILGDDLAAVAFDLPNDPEARRRAFALVHG